MKSRTNLIVMLTNNDHTVLNAKEIFEKCRSSKAEYWGVKELPLSLEQMRELFAIMKKCGKKTVLEVVAYTEEECIEGAKTAVECGCDILMGTVFSDRINEMCKSNGIKYMPFIGEVTERPSILNGNVEEMIQSANSLLKKGVYGFDLLAYRYTGDHSDLIKNFVSRVNAAVCVAGSVNSYERLDELKQASPDYFTIGSAFFDHRFGLDFTDQIDKVCEYIC